MWVSQTVIKTVFGRKSPSAGTRSIRDGMYIRCSYMEKNYSITTFNFFGGETISNAILVKEDICTAIALLPFHVLIFVHIIT
jgi:hypothetical protein